MTVALIALLLAAEPTGAPRASEPFTPEEVARYAEYAIADATLWLSFIEEANAIGNRLRSDPVGFELAMDKLQQKHDRRTMKALKTHGLSRTRAIVLERAVQEVLTGRHVSEAAEHRLRRMQRRGEDSEKARADALELKAMRLKGEALADERAKYGDAFVDAVIAHKSVFEAQLARRLGAVTEALVEGAVR